MFKVKFTSSEQASLGGQRCITSARVGKGPGIIKHLRAPQKLSIRAWSGRTQVDARPANATPTLTSAVSVVKAAKHRWAVNVASPSLARWLKQLHAAGRAVVKAATPLDGQSYTTAWLKRLHAAGRSTPHHQCHVSVVKAAKHRWAVNVASPSLARWLKQLHAAGRAVVKAATRRWTVNIIPPLAQWLKRLHAAGRSTPHHQCHVSVVKAAKHRWAVNVASPSLARWLKQLHAAGRAHVSVVKAAKHRWAVNVASSPSRWLKRLHAAGSGYTPLGGQRRITSAHVSVVKAAKHRWAVNVVSPSLARWLKRLHAAGSAVVKAATHRWTVNIIPPLAQWLKRLHAAGRSTSHHQCHVSVVKAAKHCWAVNVASPSLARWLKQLHAAVADGGALTHGGRRPGARLVVVDVVEVVDLLVVQLHGLEIDLVAKQTCRERRKVGRDAAARTFVQQTPAEGHILIQFLGLRLGPSRNGDCAIKLEIRGTL
ncbi:hypothetical protein EVAR_18609_1 [Eumeta japonica]|uniref:Uncharacterized protein n=1 Tax=Eumeta variegata TaxID=151549 RepID=A0A4C1V2S9_EUMVA|nr:hypothetical protein EVAR_18609_1 [Eumeta japonica]